MQKEIVSEKERKTAREREKKVKGWNREIGKVVI